MEEKFDICEQQQKLTDYFGTLIKQKHLAHAYLLAGPKGIGKFELARWIAQGIFCQNKIDGKPCLNCSECRRIATGNHPDIVHTVPEGLSIKVEQIRFLKSEFSKSGIESSQKVFIIENADKMTASAANSLLKFLEEPSGNVVAFLLTDTLAKILPTIISRCQVFELAKNSSKYTIGTLEKLGFSTEKALILSSLTESTEEAKLLAENDNFDKILQNTCIWYLHVLQGDLRSFVEIQTALLPLIANKEDEIVLLDLIALLVKNSISIYYNVQKNIFVKIQPEFAELIRKLNEKKITKAVELVLNTRKTLAINVSFQNVLEALTINLRQCYYA